MIAPFARGLAWAALWLFLIFAPTRPVARPLPVAAPADMRFCLVPYAGLFLPCSDVDRITRRELAV